MRSPEVVPVIFIHYKNPDFLPVAVGQAKQYNERVVLLGDDSNRDCGAEHFHFKDYLESGRRFEPVYVPMYHTTHDFDAFNLFTYQRWFILRDWMHVHNVEHALMCDTDTMVYCNAEEEQPENYLAACTAMKQQQPWRWAALGPSYWTLEGIDAFCEFTYRMYTTEEGLEKLRFKYDMHVKHDAAGGPCDMTTLYLFSVEQGERVVNLAKVRNGTTFDIAISTMGNYERLEYESEQRYDWPTKKITWKNNRPYGHNVILDQMVRFNTLHFQGARKTVMKEYARDNLLEGRRER